MNPYRVSPFAVEDERLRQAANAELGQRNLVRWRNAFIFIVAASGVWPWVHLPGLSGVQLGAALLALGCAVEHWRLGRLVRDLLRPGAASPPPPCPR
jgi:hypothetical protein